MKKVENWWNSIRERSINNTIDAINDSFVNSPSCFEVYINGAETATGVQIISGFYWWTE